MNQELIDRIEKKYKEFGRGRELVLYGLTADIVAALEDKFGKFKHIYTRNQNLLNLNNGLYFHPNRLKDLKNEVYVVVGLFINGGVYERNLLESFSFVKDEDYIFRIENYLYKGAVSKIDDYNNQICIPKGNINVNIFGGANHIEVADDCKVENLQITIKGNCNHIKINTGRFSGENVIRVTGDDASFKLKEHFGVNNFSARILNASKCEIETYLTCTDNLFIDCEPYSQIKIGKDCMSSFDVVLQSGDGHCIYDVLSKEAINIKRNDYFSGKISLGNHIWLGRKSMILGGLRETIIGDGSIIGAGSVVKGKYKNNVALAGNPANVIRENIAWTRYNFASQSISDCGEYANLTE